MAVFNNRNRNDVFTGTNGEYDQVDYTGSLRDYTFVQNDNGSITVTHPTLGTDTLWDIDGFWFSGESRWYSLSDAIALTASDNGYVDEFGVITGTTGNNQLIGTAAEDLFYGDRGNDIMDGNGASYDQVEYGGELREYTFVQNADGSVTVSHPTWGTDTLIDIDGFWFIREQAWYSMEDAIALTADLPRYRIDADDVLNGTPGDDVMNADASGTNFYGGTGDDTYNGRANNYDQINYDGDIEDYTITANADGSYTVSHDVWGTDILVDIDGLWFNGKGEWYSPADAAGPGNAPVSVMKDDIGQYSSENFDGFGDDFSDDTKKIDSISPAITEDVSVTVQDTDSNFDTYDFAAEVF